MNFVASFWAGFAGAIVFVGQLYVLLEVLDKEMAASIAQASGGLA